MPSTSSESESTNEPWSGYQPYLTGRGAIPDWITQGAPQGLSDAMSNQLAQWAGGAEGSWNQGIPTTPNAAGTAPLLDFYGGNAVPGAPGSPIPLPGGGDGISGVQPTPEPSPGGGGGIDPELEGLLGGRKLKDPWGLEGDDVWYGYGEEYRPGQSFWWDDGTG